MSQIEIQTGRSVARAMFADDGQEIVTIDESGNAYRWNARNGAAITTAASPVYSGTTDNAQAATVTKLVKNIKATGLMITKTVPSPHKKYLFTESFHHDGGDGTARVWDMGTGTKLTDIGPASSRNDVGVIAISLDERLVATTEYCPTVIECDRIVRVRETATGTEVKVLRGHENFVYHAAFSPNGKTLVTSDGLGVKRLWHVETGILLGILRGHDNEARLEFSPDGSSLVSVDRDGKVLVYPCDGCGSLDFLITRARKRVVRNMTCQERRTYIDEGAICP